MVNSTLIYSQKYIALLTEIYTVYFKNLNERIYIKNACIRYISYDNTLIAVSV